jgi:hypothetical protein
MSKIRDRAFDDLELGFIDRRVYVKPDYNITGRRKTRRQERKRYSRCKTCGGMVKMPCVLCSISFDERC